MRAKAEVLRVVRAVLSLSLMQPRPRLPTLSVTPLRPAEHYHTCGELELNRKTRGLHVKCWYNTTAHTQSESPASPYLPCHGVQHANCSARPIERMWKRRCYARRPGVANPGGKGGKSERNEHGTCSQRTGRSWSVWCPQASRAVGRNQRRDGSRLYRHILHPKGRSAYPAVSVGLRVGRPGRNGRRRRPGRVRTRRWGPEAG